MKALDVVGIEISRHDWASMACGCRKSAEHVPVDFIRFLRESTSSRAGEGWADNHVYIQSNLMQPAVATACMIMAALTTVLSVEHRRQLFVVLAYLVNGEQDDVAEECLNVVRRGSWILYEEISSGRCVDAASYAFETLELMEEEADRLRHFHKLVSVNLAPDLR